MLFAYTQNSTTCNILSIKIGLWRRINYVFLSGFHGLLSYILSNIVDGYHSFGGPLVQQVPPKCLYPSTGPRGATLKMEAAYSTERLVCIYKTTQSHSLEDHSLKAAWVRIARELSVSPKAAQSIFRGCELTPKIKDINKRRNGGGAGNIECTHVTYPNMTFLLRRAVPYG
jgi:hypothetical protein